MFNFWCKWCGSDKHNKNTCPDLGEWHGTNRKYCSFCGEEDHTTKNCPGKNRNFKQQQLEELRRRGLFDGNDLEE